MAFMNLLASSISHPLFFDYAFANALACFEDFAEIGVVAGVSFAPVAVFLDVVNDGWYIFEDLAAFFGRYALGLHFLVD